MAQVQFNNAEAHAGIAYLRLLAGERGRVSFKTWSEHYGEPVREGRREEIERLVRKAATRIDEIEDLGIWPDTVTTEKTRETRVRRMARRRGLRLEKLRRRDPHAIDYGKWLVVDADGQRHELADLDAVEDYLTRSGR